MGDGQPGVVYLLWRSLLGSFMACTNALLRKIPGRIVGETTDVDGKRAFVLTLQAREQHIRREKASSNICSNQALCALTASVYLSAMGAEGLQKAAEQSFAKAHYFAEKCLRIPGCQLRFSGEFFHEFVAQCPDIPKVMDSLEQHGILGGLPLEGDLSGCVLWCATEQNSKEEIDQAVAIMKEGVRRMNLIFETSVLGRGCSILPECGVPFPFYPKISAVKMPRAFRSCPKTISAAITRRWRAVPTA